MIDDGKGEKGEGKSMMESKGHSKFGVKGTNHIDESLLLSILLCLDFPDDLEEIQHN